MIRSTAGRFIFVCLLCAAISSGCAIIAEFLGLTGTITGRAYSEAYADDPSEITEEYGIYALLSIDPPINGVSLIETDALGNFTINEVPPGTYTIGPLHSSDRAQNVKVSASRTYELEFLTPEAGVYLYMIRTTTSSPPLDVADVRVALARSINRSVLLVDVGLTNPPATNFIPDGLAGSWSSTASEIVFSVAAANTLLTSQDAFDLAITYNGVDTINETIAQKVAAFFEALDQIHTATVTGLSWAEQFDALAAGTFEVARFGYILDSNNIYQFYKKLFASTQLVDTGYDSSAFTILLANAADAISDGDIAAYEQSIVNLNDQLVQDMPAIPIYFYD